MELKGSPPKLLNTTFDNNSFSNSHYYVRKNHVKFVVLFHKMDYYLK